MPLSKFFSVLLMIIMVFPVVGTTWAPSYPYTQHIAGQKVTVEAIAYSPHGGGDVLYGITKVFYAGKLLYTMDGYHQGGIFTSDDGQLLAIVHSYYDVYENSYPHPQKYDVDYDHVAIEVFKMGKPFKTFSFRDVIDSPILDYATGPYFYWNYYADLSGFKRAGSECKSCKETYGAKVLKICDTSEMFPDECESCRKSCDSAASAIRKIEANLNKHSMYVKQNCLYMLTNRGTVVKLDFFTMKIEHIPFDQVIPDKAKFNPPQLTRRYWKVKLPDHFEEPKVKGGRTFGKAVADLFGLSETGYQEKTAFAVFVDMMIDRTGKCVEPHPYVRVYDQKIPDSYTVDAINKEMNHKLEEWVCRQKFQTREIPLRFDKYYFECIVDLK